VGKEVHREFHERFGYAEDLFRVGVDEDDAKIYLDLWEANRRQLLEAGVGAERIVMVGECTACKVDARGEQKYFSHRGDKGVAGRMLSVVGVAG
jgi:hypothetical protein